MSNIKLYQAEGLLTGFSIEYDNSVKNKILTPKITKFETVINLNLHAVSLDGKKGGAVNADLRDYITHVFGSISGKMECIGFKTSDGKMFFAGDCNRGTPFIIGKFGAQFHGMKVGLKDGISSIKPFFKKAWQTSSVPKDDASYIEDDLIDDEVACQNLTGIELEYALYYFDEDKEMFPIKDQDDIVGESFDKVVFGAENEEKLPASAYKTKSDFTSIKKKVLAIVNPPKTPKQIQEQEKKRQEILNIQIEEHKAKKKIDNDAISSKLDKAISIHDLLPKGCVVYYNQEIPLKGEFMDKIFPPEARCLIALGKTGEQVVPQNIETEEIEGWEKIVFSKASDIFESNNFQVFIDKIEPGDILQGELGNCYFLSAIATIAEEQPDLIKSRFLFPNRSHEGCYGIFLRVNGIWKLVLIDDLFPCKRSYGKSDFAFTRSNGSELWVVLLEKAWSKLCGSYANIIGGNCSEVFNTFTHSYTESINCKKIGEEILWSKLLEGEEKNFLMSAGTGQKGQDKGLTPGHAYSLLRAKEVIDHGVKTRIVELRNPWGEGEWSGDWSDASDKWTNKLKEECQFSTAEDGKFWMNLSDFITFYEIANICKIHPKFLNVEINLNKTNTLSHLVSSLYVEEDTLCYIQIHQKYRRFVLGDGTFPRQVIFNLMLVDEKFNFLESVWSEENIECIETKLKKGQYYLISDINYRFLPDHRKHGYALTCYSEKKVRLEISKDYPDGDVILKKALISYAKTKLKPVIPAELKTQKREDAKCFKKTINNPFPGHIYVFENLTQDLTFDAELRMKDCQNAGIYDFETHLLRKDKTISYEVKPNTTEIVYIKFIDSNPKITYIEEKSLSEYCNMSLRETLEMIEKSTWVNGQKCEIEEGCGIYEYTLQHKKGYGIAFENKSKKKYKISVEWTLDNLVYSERKGESMCEFELGPGNQFFAFLATVNSTKPCSYEEGIGFDII